MAFGKPFQKGTSPNPSGRTKAQRAKERERAEVFQGVKFGGPNLIAYAERLHKIIMQGEDRDSLAGIKLVHEFVHGKITQPIVVEDNDAELTQDEIDAEELLITRERLSRMTADERSQLLTDPAPPPTIQ